MINSTPTYNPPKRDISVSQEDIADFLKEINSVNDNTYAADEVEEAIDQATMTGISPDTYLEICLDYYELLNPDQITCYGEGWRPEHIAEALIDSVGGASELLGENIDSYIDTEKLGRDLQHDGYRIINGEIVHIGW